MTDLQQVKRPDGQTCPAYLATPDGEIRGGIVVVQEWWGLNEQIKKTADRWAAIGYLALVPDLFRGKVASDADEATHFMGNLDFMDATNQDIRGCVQHLKAAGAAKVAVSGFCMGGALTILAAAKVPEADAGVCFYGIPPAEAVDPGTIGIPMQFHFADDDYWCTKDAVDGLDAKLKAGGVSYELHRYAAQHAFMNERRPEVYDEACAARAWERTTAFLAAQLG